MTMPPRAMRSNTLAEQDSFLWHSAPITTTQLVQYAGASGDFNPLHFDHHFALACGMPGVIAHGMLTLGLMGVALEQALGPADIVNNLKGRFHQPVRPGDSIQVSIHVTERSPLAGSVTLQCLLTAHVQDMLVAEGQATVALGQPAPPPPTLTG